MKHPWPILLLLLPCITVYAQTNPTTSSPSTRPAFSADLSVKPKAELLSNFPIQLELTITNTGKPLYYWCGGPARYPGAHVFHVRITDPAGAVRDLPLGNGQYQEGSGIGYEIKETQTLPAAFGPLPAGIYSIQVFGDRGGYFDSHDHHLVEEWPAMQSPSIKLVIKDDRAALKAAEEKLLKDAASSPFARDVAEVYGIDPAVKRWLDGLLNEDPKEALKSVGYLEHCRRLPPGGDAILTRAAELHLRPTRGTPDKNLLRELSLIARNILTDAALDTTIAIATAGNEVDFYARDCALSDLRCFPQKKAEEVLVKLIENKESDLYRHAVFELAGKGNPAAIDPLIAKLQSDKDAHERATAAIVLGKFRDQAVVKGALTKALQDPDESVRKAADSSLNGTTPGPRK